ncbi:armadillo-type protein [Dipodascopsis tothii]|uniref:armadillo-type protein n=1 Tax=Dipodascopsis tothii TaxID=44089 RepID=UPI0034CE70CE
MHDGGLEQIFTALQTVHNPQTTNNGRRQAQEFLDAVKQEDEAPYWGWQLASSQFRRGASGPDEPATNPDIIRHFGLALLEHAVRHKFGSYDAARRLAVREWVTTLAADVTARDVFYIKEKLAALWVAVAKRTWGPDEWRDMDALLLTMWNTSPATRELSLGIFRTLFEDVFMLDDAVAGKRSGTLSALCIEILTDEETLKSVYASRNEKLVALRTGSEGWLIRWSNLLGECLDRGVAEHESESFAVKVLLALKTCLLWTFPKAIRDAHLLERISQSLTTDNIKIKTLATDCLHILFTRSFADDEDFTAIIGAVFLTPGMATLRDVYRSIRIDVDDFNEDAYILLKKLVEMIVGLGEYLNVTKNRLPAETDLECYLQLILETTRHESLVISGLSLQFWCSVLRVEELASRREVVAILPSLLELAAERIIRYEHVDDAEISKRYLDLDFESQPELHAFLGNYRRFVDDIARLIVCRMPIDALMWLEKRLDVFFSSWSGWQISSPSLVSKKDPMFLVAYAQFAVVDAALRGVTRWNFWYTEPDKASLEVTLNQAVEGFCDRMILMEVSNPSLLRKQVQTLVQFAPLMKHVPQTMFRVLEKVLRACTFEYPENATDEEREVIRDLRNSCDTELNRLAYLMPEALMEIYSDLERIINEIISSNKLSDHEVVSFLSFLLVVSQRAEKSNKAECFMKIVDPVLSTWTDEATTKGLSQLPWFMERVGIVKIANYFKSRGVTANTDLLATSIDLEGRKLKEELKRSWAALFPIRATRIFIQYTIEKLDHSSPKFLDLLELWRPRVQPLLPYILQLISQIEAYHNPRNWADLPLEVQAFVKDSCTERFWQDGISLQSRDQFVEENVKAAHTLRDFADSLGNMLRYTREYAFLTLGSISQLESTMYEIPGVGRMLWVALAGEVNGISLHAWRHLIALVIRPAIKNCPVEHRQAFFSDLLPLVLKQLDIMLVEKWEMLTQKGLQVSGEEDEELSEEMMEEYLLRQLSGITERLLIDLIGPLTKISSTDAEKQKAGRGPNDTRTIVLSNFEILEPFLTICTHLFTVHDTRCSYNCALIFRHILPLILLQNDAVDDFLCDVVLPACFKVLTEPYFIDVHSEASYVLTIIYTALRGKYRRPFETLLGLLPAVPPDVLIALEQELAAVKSVRQQRGIMVDFLSVINAVEETSEMDAARREARAKQEKRADKERWTARNGAADGKSTVDTVLEEGSLQNLFDNDL